MQRTPLSDKNSRIRAQKGTFLNFEKLVTQKSNFSKLNRIRLTIKFDLFDYFNDYSNIYDSESESDSFFAEINKQALKELTIFFANNKDVSTVRKELQEKCEKFFNPQYSSSNFKQMDSEKQEEFFNMREKYFKEVELLADIIKKIHNSIFEDIKSKVDEFGYGQETLYPDLQMRISYLKNKYQSINIDNKVNVSKI
ncbi:hypothetical protein [Oenococcus oeni]